MSTPKHKSFESILSCKIVKTTDDSYDFVFNTPEIVIQKLTLKPFLLANPDNTIELKVDFLTSLPTPSYYSFILKLISRNTNYSRLFKTNIEINNQSPATVTISNIFPTLEKFLDPASGYISNNKIGFSVKLIKQNNKPQLKKNKSQKITKTDHTQELPKSQTRKCGLVNYGCTCYMNSCLQILYNIPLIRKELYKFDASTVLYGKKLLENIQNNTEEEKNLATLERKGKWEAKVNKIINALQIVFGKMERFKAAYYQPDELVSAFGWTSHNLLEQEDAHEFIRGILSKLEDRQIELHHFNDCMQDKKDFLNTNFNIEHFKGLSTIKNKLELKYLTCGLSNCTLQNDELNFKKEKQEEFHDLPLDVTGYNDVYESLQAYLSPENLNGENRYYTEEHGRIDVVKTTKIKRLPALLMLQLKRFNYCMETGQMSKINSKLAFYKELDMNNFVDDFEVDYSYKLFGFVVHKGHRLDSGHYYSIIDPHLNDRWYNFNDENIFQTSNDIEDYQGNDRTPICAYLLVYIRNDSIQDLMCRNENVYSYLSKSISNTIHKEKIKYEAQYIKMIENQNKNHRNTLVMFEDTLFSKLLTGISDANCSIDLWIIASYLIYGSDPFRKFITRGLGFDVPSVKWFLQGLNNIYNTQFCYKMIKESGEIKIEDKDVVPISNVENNLLNRNMIPIHISNSNSFKQMANELIYYIKGKISLFKLKIPNYNPELNFDNIAIFRLNTNPTEKNNSGIKLIYPSDLAESSNSVFMPNRNGFYICELNYSLLQNKNFSKSIVFVKQEEQFIESVNCYLNKGAFVINNDLTLCELKKLLVANNVIDNNKYYIKTEVLRNRKYIKHKIDENIKLDELSYCVVLNFDLEEIYKKYEYFTVGIGIHENLKGKINCELESNGIVSNYYKFKIKKHTIVSALKDMIKDKMGVKFDFELGANKNTNLHIYKQRKTSHLNNNTQVKNLTCNTGYINQQVINSSICESKEQEIGNNEQTHLDDRSDDNKQSFINNIHEDELEVWKVYEQFGMDKQYAASYKYYQEDFKDDTPDFFFELKEVCTLNDN